MSSDQKTIFVAGHRGMVGSAILRQLDAAGHTSVLTQRRDELDLTNQNEVKAFFSASSIDQVYLAAAKVGGIYANNRYPADFLYDNLMIQANVIQAAYESRVSRLLFLGSSCIYPKFAPQPIPETALLTGDLEPTNEAYAIAKIAGIKLCESYHRQYGCDFRSVMPTNLYGPNDNYDLKGSHVIPALLRKFHQAKLENADSVEVWGSGKPCREFLYVDDMASACHFVMNLSRAEYDSVTSERCSHLNVGTGKDISIGDLAKMVAKVTGYTGDIVFNTDMPDGTPRKLLNVERLEQLGWKAETQLQEGLVQAYRWMSQHWNELNLDGV